MNLSPAWVRTLGESGHDAVHWTEVGAFDATDRALMEWARENGCVVLTNDLDFGAILAATEAAGPSVLQLRTQDVSPWVAGDRLVAALARFEPELMAGALVTIDDRRERARILPIPPRE